MRLSKLISNRRYYDTTEIMLFHGTAKKHLKSFLDRGIGIVKEVEHKKKDFGQGFYLTTQYWQARDYANRIAKVTKTDPMIVVCILKLGKLRESIDRGLIIDDYDERWLETIIRGRFHSHKHPLNRDYDWIYGRCGDGSTEKFTELVQKEKTDSKLLLKHIMPNEDHPYYEFDQLWLGTKEAINFIEFVRYFDLKGDGVYEKIPIHKW